MIICTSSLLVRSLRGGLSWREFSSGSTKSIKHVVMFRFKPETTESEMQAVQKALLNLPLQLPEIQTFELGTDLKLESGQKHPAGPNRQVCWTATFKSVQEYQSYNDSPAHVQFLQQLGPIVEPGSRAAIQYVSSSLTQPKSRE